MAKKKTISAQAITDAYMAHVLNHNEKPKSVFAFAEANGMKEAEFYQFYASFEVLEKQIFQTFFEHTTALLQKDDAYADFDAQNKLLSFYFTFFEILKANRSYVVYALKQNKNMLDSMKNVSLLRDSFKNYIDDLDIETIDLKQEFLENAKQRSLGELAWGQLLVTLKFWLDDESANFEKTDLFIEKSIHASFDLIKTPPLASLVDFGKFLFKEKIKPKM